MTDTLSLARPYANAVFDVAKSAHQLPSWSLVLQKLSSIIVDGEMQQLLKNPNVTKKQLSELLMGVLNALNGKDAIDNHNEIENFIKVLAEKKRLNLLPFIAELFEESCAKESGYISLTVTSAFLMDDLQRENAIKKLSQQLNSELKINFFVDEDLIGGLLIRSGNWVLDDTIKGKLARLKSALI